MNPEEYNRKKRELEQELQGSEWLQKFKQLSFGLRQLKAEIPLTQLCKLQWLTESETLAIHCPNPEVREGLCRQKTQLAQLNIMARRFVIQYPALPDAIVYRGNSVE
ncbi:hypothetical protein IQ249_13140 [Lusitaniella coriacea LEGE 07157]|uniref:Uncharacterized protein n=1 Tax=Lusitaniella coriacea LEGE 07157 TaxID=945747 RepID=A0A8J7JB96_9CYAN|nr:hypothetical protein [Lusitaniella coriacea LEGE 07157]